MQRRATSVQTGETDGHRWLVAERPLHPGLAGAVRRVVGYEESTPGPLARPEMPGATLTCIVEIGPAIAVDGVRHGGFLAGLHERPALTVHDGWQAGVQIDLGPLGASRLLGDDASRLKGRVETLDDVLPAAARGLGPRLAELPGWPARLDLVERWLLDRIGRAPAPPPWLDWAWRRILTTGGGVPMEQLAGELGYTRRHVARVFREAIGVSPKRYALLVRFDRLMALLDRGPPMDWAERAARLGYADQAHMVRDVRRFAGMTPTALARLRGADVSFVQDGRGGHGL